ncbi:flavin reductase family protein [Spongisporangium articulatum]|uniref:Flavin reductase family protein n=1 Tax=Spongisporangium articulatum TaxID=3362603 RepID=A0ABW8AQ79_9ACTN
MPEDGVEVGAGAEVGVEVGAYRRAVGRFATGICVITTRAGEQDHAMTVNTFTSVSLEPVLCLVSVETEARFHDAVLAAGFWGVSVLDGTARATAAWLATRGRPLHGQLDRVPFHRGPVTGTALLDASLATLECRTWAVHPAGDHSIVVGEVVGVHEYDPAPGALVYHRGDYLRLE